MSADWHAPGAAERPFTIRGMFRFVVRNGLIAHRVDYWDSADFRRQVQGDSAQPKR
jgi:ketosteroid isomerase-like protein